MDFKRVAGWSALVAALFFILNLIFAGVPPAPEDGVVGIGEHLAENTGAHKTALLFVVVGSIPLVTFLAGFLIPFFRSDRDNNEAFGVVIFAGLLLLGAGAAIGNAAAGTLYLRGGGGLDAPTVRGLWDLQSMGYGSGVTMGLTLFAGGVAMAVFRRGVMPIWVGQLSAFVAVLGPLGLFAMLSDGNASQLGYLPFFGFIVWLVAVGAYMVRSSTPTA